jgi:acyl-CoA thioesterase I
MRVAGLILFVILCLGQPVWAGQKLLVFGDSLASGFGLPDTDGFAGQLDTWLRGQGRDVEVINAGIAGDTTSGGLKRIERALTPDIDAVIVIIGGNDLIQVQPAERIRSNLDGILDAISARGLPVLLAGMPAPAHLGKPYQRAARAIYPAVATDHGAILYPNFLAPVARDKNILQIMFLFQTDGLHPNRRGVRLIVADIGPYVLRLLDAAR